MSNLIAIVLDDELHAELVRVRLLKMQAEDQLELEGILEGCGRQIAEDFAFRGC